MPGEGPLPAISGLPLLHPWRGRRLWRDFSARGTQVISQSVEPAPAGGLTTARRRTPHRATPFF